MSGLRNTLDQAFCSGKPKFTAKDVPDLTDKVIIVTGSNTGMGKEIAQILYSKNAKVYMMARSEDKTRKAIDEIRLAVPKSMGDLVFARLDLADLAQVKASAQDFLNRESKLDLLFNNAGVGYPERGSETKQGYELQVGVNCIGSFALTHHLAPILVSTAKRSPANSVRVVWTSSSAAEGTSTKSFLDNVSRAKVIGSASAYFVSKLGNYLHATEFAARHRSDGVLSIPLNPGNLDSDFWRTQGSIVSGILRSTVLYPPINGAYTALFAGLSPEITLEKSGHFVAPWGRLYKVSDDMINASKPLAEGGTGIARQFWQWTESQVKNFL